MGPACMIPRRSSRRRRSESRNDELDDETGLRPRSLSDQPTTSTTTLTDIPIPNSNSMDGVEICTWSSIEDLESSTPHLPNVSTDRNSEKLKQEEDPDPASIFRPKLTNAILHPPSFTTDSMRQHVIQDLPHRYRRSNWRLLYATKEHGISLFTWLDRSEKKGPSVVFVRSDSGEVFGAFVSRSWRHSRKYYGTGESFVFRWDKENEEEKDEDEEEETYESFRWSHTNRLFCLSNLDVISIGGGGEGPAIYLDNDLLHGSSSNCETFASVPLVKEKEFRVVIIEVWGFVRNREKKEVHVVSLEEKVEKIEMRAAEALTQNDGGSGGGVKPTVQLEERK